MAEPVLRAFLAHLPHPAWVKDLQGRYVDVNPAFELAHGVRRADVLGRGEDELLGPAAAARARGRDRAAAEGRGAQVAREALVRDGVRSESVVVRFPILDGEGQVLALGGVATDVTRLAAAGRELRALTERLRRERASAQDGARLHDLGNVLLSVGGWVELALRDLPSDAPAAALLREALAATARARELAAGPPAPPAPGARTALRPLAEEALRLLAVQAPPGVALHLEGEAPEVAADAVTLLSALLNLGRNALAAMPQGGELRLRLAARESADPGAPGVAPAGWALVEVLDSGAGMPPEVLARLFEPGFTTRPGGHGIGLHSARATLRACGGELRARSEAGRGSAFEAWLPAAAHGPAPARDGRPAVTRW